MLLGTSPGASSQTVTPTATTITITVFRASSGGCKNRVTWSGIAVRPTAGTPLASGNIVKSGTAPIVGVTGSTNFGTLTEVVGAINSVVVSPTGAQSLAGGATLQFTAQGKDAFNNNISGLIYTWAVVPGTGTGSVNSSGLFTAGNPGTVTVTASNGGKTGSSGTITISKLNQTITFGALADKQYGASDFAVTASASSGLTVSFTSQTPTICTVTTGTVHLVAVGTCTIRASQAGNTSYNPAPDVDQSFGVTKADQTITFSQPADTALSAGTVSLTASASSGLTVAFTSDTLSVCTVSGNTVTLLTAGTCTIKATQAGNTTYNAAPDVTHSFAVTKSNQTITFGAPSPSALWRTNNMALQTLPSPLQLPLASPFPSLPKRQPFVPSLLALFI
ncbi:MAG: hypothetical protein NT041_02455 [Candidatus Vogelbacteria bacterium]|nr:hypothetical protein [Candidatus Vogelbacteria bacterium]